MSIPKSKITNFAGGLNNNTDARLIDDNQLSEVVNILPDEIGGVSKLKVWKKDLVYDVGSVDDKLGNFTDTVPTTIDAAPAEVNNKYGAYLPKFEHRKHVLYLANNTYDTTFSGEEPYTVTVASDGSASLTDNINDFIDLKPSTAAYIRVGVYLPKAVTVSSSDSITFSVVVSPGGGVPSTSNVTGRLFSIDGNPVANFGSVNPTGTISDIVITQLGRMQFEFTPSIDTVLNAGEYFVELIPDSETNYYKLLKSPSYKTSNILGWTERSAPGAETAVNLLDSITDSGGAIPSVVLEADYTPPVNDNSYNYYSGNATFLVDLQRSNTSPTLDVNGQATVAINYSTKTFTQSFPDYVSGAYAKGSVARVGETDYVCTSALEQEFTHTEPLFDASATIHIGPTDSKWPASTQVFGGTNLQEEYSDGILLSKSIDFEMKDDMVLDEVRLATGANIHWTEGDGTVSTTTYETRKVLRDENDTRVYSSGDSDVTAGIALTTVLYTTFPVVNGQRVMRIHATPNVTGEGFWAPDLMYFTTKKTYQWQDGVANPAWSTDSFNLAPTVTFSEQDLGSGQTVDNQTVTVTYGENTAITNVVLTDNVSYSTDAFKTQDDKLAEVIVFQGSSDSDSYAVSVNSVETYYNPTNADGASTGLDKVPGYVVRLFTNGSGLYTVAGIPPTANQSIKRAHGRMLNTYDYQLGGGLYNPNFIGDINSMVSFQNNLIVAGVGGLAVLKLNGLDESGNVKFSDIVVPDIQSRLYSKYGTKLESFAPEIKALAVHGTNPGRLFAAYEDTLIWSGGTGDGEVGDVTKWAGLAFAEIGDSSDSIKELVSFGDRLLIFTTRGDLYILSGEVPIDPALGFGSMRLDKIAYVGQIDKYAVSNLNRLFFTTTDGALWSTDSSLRPEQFDRRIGSNLSIESMHWDDREQQLWMSSGGYAIRTYSTGSVREEPCSFVWDSKTDSWWKVRNPSDSTAGTVRYGKESWRVGVSYGVDEYTPEVTVEVAGEDDFVTHYYDDAVNQPINSVYHDADSEAIIITKEFDLGTELAKQVREVLTFARLYNGALVEVSVIGSDGVEVNLGTLTGSTDFDFPEEKLARRPVGAMARMHSFRIKLKVTSAYDEKFRDLHVKHLVRGNPRFPS